MHKNTPRPHLTLCYPFPKCYHSNTLQSKPNTGCDLFLPTWLRGRTKRTETTTFERLHINLCRWCQHFPPYQPNRISNHLMNGHLPTALQPFLYGAQLHGLRKNNGDLSPIAVGCTYWCLVAKVCLRPYISRLRELLQPSQLGVGTPRGYEAAVHATRSFMVQIQGEKVFLKLDVKNAFNSIRRDTVLQAAQTHLPEIYPFIWDCYSSKTSLFHGEFCLDSATGVQQGDPLGSFCPCHSRSYIRGQISPKCLVIWWRMCWWWPADRAQ